MTVASLWKALDTASSGQPIGVNEIAQVIDVRNDNNGNSRPKATLAVDLSIWICESMTTFGINEQHASPALHLVFTRTMKLLNLGLGLIFVIEGKQRVTSSLPADAKLISRGAPNDTFRKRRSGTFFWKACNDCQTLLELLGVPVVRAKSEGEALCALLCSQGIVDGVISNDGDCLLFGATAVYTKFSNENLENGRIMRYCSDSLFAVADPNEETIHSSDRRIKLSRHDLIAFAVLTGSDLTGKGLEKVGHKKALRFIRKCQLDNPLTTETAAYDEMKSWAIAATANNYDHPHDNSKCCTRCHHVGSKRNHAKNGCIQCGTNPGEACYQVTSEDRLRLSLRAKAMEMKFDPSKVFGNYLRPNENQLPMQLLTHGVQMGVPKLGELMQMDLIVKGHSLQGSQTFVRQAVLRLLSRYELSGVHVTGRNITAVNFSDLIHNDRPVAKSINKSLSHNHIPSYEIVWEMKATLTDVHGEGVDGYEYVTIEPKILVEQKYPQLLFSFEQKEAKRSKQGDGMKNWRRDFLQSFCLQKLEQVEENNPILEQIVKKKPSHHLDKKRKGGFSKKVTVHKRHRKGKENASGGSSGEDIRNLLRFVRNKQTVILPPLPKQYKPLGRNNSMMSCENGVPSSLRELVVVHNIISGTSSAKPQLPQSPTSLNEDDELFCTMGGYNVQITPIASNHGTFPPNHIYIRQPDQEFNEN